MQSRKVLGILEYLGGIETVFLINIWVFLLKLILEYLGGIET